MAVVVPTIGAGLAPLPTPQGNALPIPQTVFRPRAELRSAAPDAEIRYFMLGPSGWVDITDYVSTSIWQHGSQLPNRIGGAMTPATGTLLLRNEEGEWSPINPLPELDPYPGAPVYITRNGNVRFRGWSAGVIEASDLEQNYLATMTLYSSMTRVEEHEEGIFAKAPRHVTWTEAVNIALDQVDWPANRRRVSQSTLELRGDQLNLRGVLSQGSRRVKFTAAAQVLGVIEGGPAYDDHEGNLVFTTYADRRVTPPVVKRVTDPISVETLGLDRLVVNVIEEEQDVLASRGVGRLEFDEELPVRVVVPPGGEAGVTLTIADPKIKTVESWEPLVRGQHYTYSLALNVEFQTYDRHCRILFRNPTPVFQTAEVLGVDGEAFSARFSATLIERSGASIGHYGPKSIIYPDNLTLSFADARARAKVYLQEWAGVGPNGEKSPKLALKVRLLNPELDFNVNDLVLLDWEVTRDDGTIGQRCLGWPFWVDSAEYAVTSAGDLIVSLTMQSGFPLWARPTAAEPQPGDIPLPMPHLNEVVVGVLTVPRLSPGVELLVGSLVVPPPVFVPEQLVGVLVVPQTRPAAEQLVGTFYLNSLTANEQLVGTLKVRAVTGEEVLVGVLRAGDTGPEFLVGTLVVTEIPLSFTDVCRFNVGEFLVGRMSM